MMSLVSASKQTVLNRFYSFGLSCVKALRTPNGSERALPEGRAALAAEDTLPPQLARPLARLAVGTLLNGRERWIPTQFAASSSWTALCQVAQMARAAGGFEARSISVPITTAQIWLPGCTDIGRVQRRIQAVAGDLLQVGLDALPENCIPIGCIPALELHEQGGDNLGAILHVESVDDLGRRVLAAAAPAIASRLVLLAECRGKPDIQFGVLETERVRVRCRIKLCHIADGAPQQATMQGQERRVPIGFDKLMRDFGIDSHQPDLAALHNAHVLEGLTVAAAALGIDARCMVVAARRHAARWGSCESLAKWRKMGDVMVGELCIPVDLRLVYDLLRRQDDQSLDVVALQAARDLVIQVATIGLAASLAYLRSVLLAGPAQRNQRSNPPAPLPTALEARPGRRPPPKKIESGVHRTARAGDRGERSAAAGH